MLPNEAQPRRSSRASGRGGEMDMHDLMDVVQESIEAHTSSLVSPTSAAPKNPFESLPRRPSTLTMSSAHASSDEVPRAHRPLPRPPAPLPLRPTLRPIRSLPPSLAAWSR